jgi:hypothetical protein
MLPEARGARQSPHEASTERPRAVCRHGEVLAGALTGGPGTVEHTGGTSEYKRIQPVSFLQHEAERSGGGKPRLQKKERGAGVTCQINPQKQAGEPDKTVCPYNKTLWQEINNGAVAMISFLYTGEAFRFPQLSIGACIIIARFIHVLLYRSVKPFF